MKLCNKVKVYMPENILIFAEEKGKNKNRLLKFPLRKYIKILSSLLLTLL